MPAAASTGGSPSSEFVVRLRRQKNSRAIAERRVRTGTTIAAASAPLVRSCSGCGIGVGEGVCEGMAETERLSEAIEGQEGWDDVVRNV
jgi:hypothetical protein